MPFWKGTFCWAEAMVAINRTASDAFISIKPL
jgi:hypothetical protein